MKPCTYCGRENQDDAIYCRECGTEFVTPAAATEPHERRSFSWLEYGLAYTGVCFVIACVYLLSLGPVMYYWGKTTRVVPPITLRAKTTIVVRTTYPRWVGVVYYPAFSLLSGNRVGSLYREYLQWWDKRKAPRP